MKLHSLPNSLNPEEWKEGWTRFYVNLETEHEIDTYEFSWLYLKGKIKDIELDGIRFNKCFIDAWITRDVAAIETAGFVITNERVFNMLWRL